MNNIVERLRDKSLVIQHPERKRISDLIEQQAAILEERDDMIRSQAARIAVLEAERVVSGAMCVIEGRCLSGEQHQRIKELEAERDELIGANMLNRNAVRLAQEKLAALRQRIDDQREAYIIACENEKCGEVEEYGKGWDAAILACVKAIRARGI